MTGIDGHVPETLVIEAINDADVEVFPPLPERLDGDNAARVAHAAAEHFILLAGLDDSLVENQRSRDAAMGTVRRVLASLAAARLLDPDFDPTDVVEGLNAMAEESRQ